MIDFGSRPTVARVSSSSRLRLVAPTPVRPRLRLFGGGMIEIGDGALTGRGAQRHRIALLAMLVTTRRPYRTRDQLIFHLWPEVHLERGRRLLSDSIYRVNAALGGEVIVAARDGIHLDQSLLASDVAELDAATDACDWHAVVELHAAPFLDGFFVPGSTEFDLWMESKRVHYMRAAARAMESLAVAARDAGHFVESAEWWQRLAQLIPDDSRVAMELMRALDAVGQRAQAVRHAQRHAALFRDTLDIEPPHDVQVLADQLAGRRRAP